MHKIKWYIWIEGKSTRLMWSLQWSLPFLHWWERTWNFYVFSCCCLNKVVNCNDHVNLELLLCVVTRQVNFKLMRSCPSRCIIHITLAIVMCQGLITFTLTMRICKQWSSCCNLLQDISVVVAQLWQHQITTIQFWLTTLHCFAHLGPSTTPMQGHAQLDFTAPLEQQNQRSAHQEPLVARQSCFP